MDLPTCPACGQSVIDDDAKECPFCGSSMSAPRKTQTPTRQSASSAPAKAPPAKGPDKPVAANSTAASSAPAAAASKPTPKQAKPSGMQDDAPFEVDTSAIQKAIPAAPRRVKGRPFRVVCPMCETVGYVPAAASEQDVRCANPNCLVPVFTAPKLERKPVVQEEPEPTGLSATVWVAIVLMLLAAAGSSVWFFVLRRPAPPVVDSTTDPSQIADRPAAPDQPAVPTTNPANETATTDTATDSPRPKPLTLDEVRPSILKQMIAASQEPGQNRSKPYCRQLTAQAFVDCGDLANAREQLERLEFVGERVPFHKIPPLVEIAWSELAAGQDNAARQALDEAYQAAPSLPKFGQAAVRSAVSLAGGLAAVGRADDARSLIDRYRNEVAVGRLVIWLKNAYDTGTFDLEASSAEEPLLPSATPLWVAVTSDLAARGLWATAESWARAHPDPIEQARNLTVCAETAYRTLARQSDDPLKQRFDRIVGELGPVAQSVVYARASRWESTAGDRSAAEQAVEQAKAALASLNGPSEIRIPGMRELYGMTLPPSEPLQFAALAASEIARAEAQLGRFEEAATFLLTALDYLRSIAPSPSAIGQRVDEIDRSGTNSIRDRLTAALNLSSIDEAQQAVRRYRRTCRTIQDASDHRFRLQVSLLARAIEWNLLDAVADEMATRQNMEDPDRREPFDRTPLPILLATRYRAAGNTARAEDVEAKFPQLQDSADLLSQIPWMPELIFTNVIAGLIERGELATVAARLQLGGTAIGSVWQDRWSMQFASQLVKSGKPNEAFQLIRHYKDPLLREQTYELVAALGTRLGYGRQILQLAEESKFVPTAQISVLRGVLIGLLARDRAAEDRASVSEHGDQSTDSG